MKTNMTVCRYMPPPSVKAIGQREAASYNDKLFGQLIKNDDECCGKGYKQS